MSAPKTATLFTPLSTPSLVADKSEASSTATIAGYIGQLSTTMTAAIEEINDVNANTQLLALNARIEAARAGQAGAAFSVVAEEMQALGSKTSTIATGLASTTRKSIDQLLDFIGNNIRGTRLSDLALTNIDLVDRNLYERTCDVRWWATDSSLVDALTDGTPEAIKHASQRMGVILGAYTVYYDLVLCDTQGRIVANGMPQRFGSQGQSAANASWFLEAMHSRSGDEYGFQTAHHSPLVDGESVLVYSCGVREGGSSTGKLLGALGILFNWEGLAQTIVENVPLSPKEREATRCVLCDDAGNIIADSWGKQLSDRLALPGQKQLFTQPKNYETVELDGRPWCVAHAQAPGFETYSTGWHSVILQPIEA
ncbi:methyl-accepting chemotaxis protein [Botrimarina hoheduenensis]|nr:methyl-accepting chemotaxis protein [Botrimarina hoheduenensis]